MKCPKYGGKYEIKLLNEGSEKLLQAEKEELKTQICLCILSDH